MTFDLHLGDCLEMLRAMPDNSVDSIVTDPPYGLTSARPGGRSPATEGAVMRGFMGLQWDGSVPSAEVWTECLRVLKPGGYLLAFAGTRTQHRMACAIEEGGFEIRDMIAWVYGSGFPKHVSCLKPALEPITMARKPAKYSVPLNIDECRVGDTVETWPATRSYQRAEPGAPSKGTQSAGDAPAGRWPANLIHDGSDDVLASFPEAKGQQGAVTGEEPSSKTNNVYSQFNGRPATQPRGDTGSAARFFYCAKASKKDRGEGNKHPTVKPTELMRYLCRLVTPPGGVVLDPFAGSGSTGKAAVLEGFRFVGCELSPEYLEIANHRIAVELFGDLA